ncbi:MAG: NapC/NirT family cytochrome c [Rhodocyclales bacterium]|nr:NapC/NirT family cytochrome c [Rhodocyclales bacterium]
MTEQKKGLIGKLRAAGLVTVVLVFGAGIVFWGGFNTVLEWTNTETFCISCHEMEANVYKEYRQTVHYQNRTGVRATCPDCHVPKEWGPKMVRKLYASNELWHHFLGTVNTPEKFRAKRIKLAENEWKRMRANDSRECRNCHSFEYFDYSVQGRRSNQAHQKGLTENKTCIDCHKGIAHSLPPIEQQIGSEREAVAPEVFRPPAKAE